MRGCGCDCGVVNVELGMGLENFYFHGGKRREGTSRHAACTQDYDVRVKRSSFGRDIRNL